MMDVELDRRTVADHANHADTHQCPICQVSRCFAYSTAMARLILAGVDPRPGGHRRT